MAVMLCYRVDLDLNDSIFDICSGYLTVPPHVIQQTQIQSILG
jgi:hypothetical protein